MRVCLTDDGGMTDFLSETNLCGQTLLRLVSKGNAIIAELLRLSHYIPDVFAVDLSSSLANPEQKRYADIIFDFRYLKTADYLEHKIQSSAVSILKNFYIFFLKQTFF